MVSAVAGRRFEKPDYLPRNRLAGACYKTLTLSAGAMSDLAPPVTNGRYNYEHFTREELFHDIREYPTQAPQAGDEAPPFELRDVSGREWRLSELRDRPVVLITGSASCPLTRGSMPSLREVYRDFRDSAHWFTLYVREANPGEKLPRHESFEQKLDHAGFFQRAEDVPWPILVDGVDGEVHQAYGLLPNGVYLIGTDGRIAFRQKLAHGPTLRMALGGLLKQEGRGIVMSGEDARMHLLGATAYGWKAIERAGEGAVDDVAAELPPLAVNLWLGSKMERVLNPVARRSQPLPPSVRVGAVAAAAVMAGFGIWKLLKR